MLRVPSGATAVAGEGMFVYLPAPRFVALTGCCQLRRGLHLSGWQLALISLVVFPSFFTALAVHWVRGLVPGERLASSLVPPVVKENEGKEKKKNGKC